MQPFLKKEEITTTAKVVGMLPGDPLKLNLVSYTTGRDGSKRHFTRQVPVVDKDLSAKLMSEVNVGDYVQVTTMNEYTEMGSRVYLADFHKVDNIAPNRTNGTNAALRDISQIPITTSVIEPIVLDTTKVTIEEK